MTGGRDDRVPLLEVFSSFQGEGPRVGERQVFVRLAGCDLRCAFCDTPESFPAPARARVQVRPDADEDERPANPVAVPDVAAWARRLDRPAGLHAAASLTGGEPLLHAAALLRLAPLLSEAGLRVHLETGGHRPEELARVLPVVDEVTPDLKLQSATREPTPWERHGRVYDLLAGAGKALAVKAVVAEGTDEAEVARAAAFAAERLPGVPLVLQPVTPFEDGPLPPAPSLLFRLHAAARAVHPDVRAIPQVHRALGIR
jgi:organic radical activating enzyme